MTGSVARGAAALWAALVIAGLAVSAEIAPGTGRAEIAYLLRTVQTSGCQFRRNGVWYDAEKASSHLRSKYELLLVRNPSPSAETFIANVGTRSSLTGLAYQMRCGTGEIMASSDWLLCKLARLRAAAGTDISCAPCVKPGAQEKGLAEAGETVTCPA